MFTFSLIPVNTHTLIMTLSLSLFKKLSLVTIKSPKYEGKLISLNAPPK